MNHRRTDRRAPALWMTLCLVACSTTLTGRQQLTLIPDDQMESLGGSAFTDLKQKQDIEHNLAINEYVQCIASALLQVIPEGGAAPEDEPWEVVVFEDPTPNAFALPGGKIGVHTGMLDVATTPGQLASVIGHEVGHVVLRHGNERLSQSVVAESALQVGAVALGEMTPEYRDLVVGGLGLGAQYGVLLPFSRKHENEADEVGQRFMAQAGFNPAEAITLWQKMAKLSGASPPPEWLSTHPAHETRIERLQANLPVAVALFREARAAGRNPNCVPPGG